MSLHIGFWLVGYSVFTVLWFVIVGFWTMYDKYDVQLMTLPLRPWLWPIFAYKILKAICLAIINDILEYL